MMARAEADRASREAMAGMRDNTSRRGQDLTNEDRDALRTLKEGQEKIANALAERKQKEVERHNPIAEGNAQQGNTVRALTARDADGNPVAAVDPATASLPPGVSIATPPLDSNVAPDSKTGRDKAKAELQESNELRPLLENVRTKFDATNDEDYGTLQGGSIPWLSDKLRGFGLPGNVNELEAAQVAAGKGDDAMNQRVARRQEFTATRQDLASIIQRLRTGLAANKQEMDRIDTIQGVIDGKEFSSKKEVRGQVMQQIFDMYNRNAAVLEQRVKDRGVRINQGPVAGPLDVAQLGQRREPPPQAAPGPLDAPQTQEDPVVARKRRIEVGSRDPAIKAKLKAARDALPPDMPPEQVGEELHKLLEQLVP
jgi:hypothetical protein